MSCLALGWGHRYGADTTLGHALTLRGNRDCHVCQSAQAVGQAWHQEPVSLFDRASFLRPDLGFARAPRAAAVKTGPTKGRATAGGGLVLMVASTAPDWARLGSAIMPPVAAPPSCARPGAACSGSGCLRASSRGSRRRARAPAAGSFRGGGEGAQPGCAASVPD